jgi:hypothetical protein
MGHLIVEHRTEELVEPNIIGIRVACAIEAEREVATALVNTLTAIGGLSVPPVSQLGCGLETAVYVGTRPSPK